MKTLRIAPPCALIRPTATTTTRIAPTTRPTTPALRLSRPQTRTFLPNPFAALSNSSSSPSSTTPQHLTASRTLPYPSLAIYNIIADVSSYHTFLPYCQRSTVTRWSRPDTATGTRWPAAAELAVGWGGISEAFSSRVYCVPGSIVEAVGGASRTRLRPEQMAHHDLDTTETQKGGGSEILTHLLTRWTVSPFPYQPPSSTTTPAKAGENAVDPREPASGQAREQTQVSLEIEFAFANPLYATMSAAVTPMVANRMIEAFEKRVEQLLDGPGLGGTKHRVPSEGVLSHNGPLKR